MEYHQYNLEDFLVDPEFRNWVLRPDPSNHFFWKKCLDANPGLKRKAMAAKEIILSLEFRSPEASDTMDKGDFLKIILAQKGPREAPWGKLWLHWGMQAAACVLALIALTLGLHAHTSTKIVAQDNRSTSVVKENLRGEKSKIGLPDGSTVYLNNNSKISYRSKFDSKREIFLQGEAFFEVAKDSTRPFLVHANGLLTKALGTSFNIKAPPGEPVEVGLVQGKILVSPNYGEQHARVIDDQGGKATFDVERGKLDISTYPDMDFYQWTKRIIIFKAASFEEVRETLENWYNVDIGVENLQRPINFTGRFQGQSLETVLEQLAYTERFTFAIDKEDQRKITIRF